jgi:hypothetical protein
LSVGRLGLRVKRSKNGASFPIPSTLNSRPSTFKSST